MLVPAGGHDQIGYSGRADPMTPELHDDIRDWHPTWGGASVPVDNSRFWRQGQRARYTREGGSPSAGECGRDGFGRGGAGSGGPDRVRPARNEPRGNDFRSNESGNWTELGNWTGRRPALPPLWTAPPVRPVTGTPSAPAAGATPSRTARWLPHCRSRLRAAKRAGATVLSALFRSGHDGGRIEW